MGCETCAGIADQVRAAPNPRGGSTVEYSWNSIQKSAQNGCLSCGVVEGTIRAGVIEGSGGVITALFARTDCKTMRIIVGSRAVNSNQDYLYVLFPFSVESKPSRYL